MDINKNVTSLFIFLSFIFLALSIFGLAGCSPKEYRLRADREVEEIIELKQLQIKG